MKNKYLLLVLLANILTFNSFGQIPGYLGKRFIIQTNIHSMLAFAGPTAANKGINPTRLFESDKSSFALSNSIALQAEYAISRKSSIFLGVDYYKTGMALNINTLVLNTSGSFSNFDYHKLFYNISNFGINLGFSNYLAGKGALAPMGKHRTVALWASFVDGQILDKKTDYSDQNVSTHEKILINPKFMRYGISFATAENRIFLDKLVLNIGWQIKIPFDVFAYESAANYGTDGTALGNQATYEGNARFRLRNHDLFTVKIGFGYLAF